MQSLSPVAQHPQYLTFQVASEEFAIGVLNVREIIEFPEITSVPNTPDFIRGVINLRGHVVAVVDLAVKFGAPPSIISKRSCIIVIETHNEGETIVMGVVADSVRHVIEFGQDDIEPPPAFGAAVDVAYLVGMGKLNDQFVLILNIERILGAEEFPVLAMASDAASVIRDESKTNDASSGEHV